MDEQINQTKPNQSPTELMQQVQCFCHCGSTAGTDVLA